MHLELVAIKNGNCYETGIIDKNCLSGENLVLLYQANLVNRWGVIMVTNALGQVVPFNIDVTAKLISLNGTKVYSIISENPGSSMRYYYTDERPFFNDMRLRSAPRGYYVPVKRMLFSSPDRAHWLLLQNKYNLTIYTGYDTHHLALILPTANNVELINLIATLPL